MDVQHGTPTQDVLIGQTIGNYLVTQKLGEGGMGSVYLAEHPTIGKKVALKVLHSEFSSNSEVIQRFFHEAKSVNDIGHPNIVDIIDYGVLQTGQRGESLVYFIMEHLAGLTLSQVCQKDAPIPPERALAIALQVADALAASHKCGIVHRDLKPDNIILLNRSRERDFVKLLDFGIAKLTGPGDGMSQHRTRTGIVMGTPAYMSPEQCEGRGSVDHRTDIYALGVVLYEMLTGRVPFIGEGYGEILVQHLTQLPIPPSQYRLMPPHVEIVVLKALEKRAELRYPTMDEFMRAMADPVGYVEANGGIGGFLQRQLTPSMAPLPSARLTPPPLGTPGVTGYTPIPGSLQNPYATPTPTTLGQATGQVSQPRGKGLFIVLGIAVVAAAAVAIAVVVTKGGGKTEVASQPLGSDAIVAAKGSDPIVKPPTPGSDTVVKPPTPGSAAVVVPTAGSAGSAVVPPGNGSATVVNDMIELTVDTTPPGATIIFNGVEVGVTPTKVPVPRGKGKQATLKLVLHGYADETIRNVDLGSDASLVRTLKKLKGVPLLPPGKGSAVVPPPGKGSAVVPPPGKGSGKSDDTGLMKPGD